MRTRNHLANPPRQFSLLSLIGGIRRAAAWLAMRSTRTSDGSRGSEHEEINRDDIAATYDGGIRLFNGLAYTYPELERDMRRRAASERMTVIHLMVLMGIGGR